MLYSIPFNFKILIKIFIIRTFLLLKVKYREDCVIELIGNLIINHSFLNKVSILNRLGIDFTFDIIRGSVSIHDYSGLNIITSSFVSGDVIVYSKNSCNIQNLVCDRLVIIGNKTNLTLKDIKCDSLELSSISSFKYCNLIYSSLYLSFSHIESLDLNGFDSFVIRNSKLYNLSLDDVLNVSLLGSKVYKIDVKNINSLNIESVKYKVLNTDNIGSFNFKGKN